MKHLRADAVIPRAASSRTGDGIAFVFPGQGSQRVGMGLLAKRHSSAAGAIWDLAARVIGAEILEACSNGPIERIEQTEVAQPALVVAGLAVCAWMEEAGFMPSAVAGHSVGELAALAAAEALEPDAAMLLALRRGELMASVRERGIMSSVVGATPDDVAHWCDGYEGPGCVVMAAVNGPRHAVISGTEEAVAWCEGMLRVHLRARISRLHVSNAFHSPLMASVESEWRRILDEFSFRTPRIALVMNVTGAAESEPRAIRHNLAAQLVSPVQWLETIRALEQLGLRVGLECAEHPTLTRLMRRTTNALVPMTPEEALTAAPQASDGAGHDIFR